MSKGQLFRGERSSFLDPRTGVEIVQHTHAPAIHHTLYFTNPSITDDGTWLLFVSDRAGGWNLFAAHRNEDLIVQLTESGDVHPSSPVPARGEARVFYTAGSQVRSVCLDSLSESVLADFGEGRLGGLSLNASGSRLLTVLYRGDSAALALVSTRRSGTEIIYEPPREVFYAQFCPVNDRWILYASGIHQRMWVVSDTGLKDRPLYLHNASQWITHESWLGGSETVLFTRWRYGLMAVERNGDGVRTLVRGPVWHASSRRDGSLIVADTARPDAGLWLIHPRTGHVRVLCFPDASAKGSRWDEETPENGPITPETYGPQWTHPHPAFSPDGAWVSYTSDKTGYPQVYTARVPPNGEEEIRSGETR